MDIESKPPTFCGNLADKKGRFQRKHNSAKQKKIRIFIPKYTQKGGGKVRGKSGKRACKLRVFPIVHRLFPKGSGPTKSYTPVNISDYGRPGWFRNFFVCIILTVVFFKRKKFILTRLLLQKEKKFFFGRNYILCPEKYKPQFMYSFKKYGKKAENF